jgi:hypothetical protein
VGDQARDTFGQWARGRAPAHLRRRPAGTTLLTAARYPWVGHRPLTEQERDAQEHDRPIRRGAYRSPHADDGVKLWTPPVGELKWSDPRGLEWKVSQPSTTISDEGHGTVITLLSVTGVEDKVHDVIHPGAYADTLTVRTPKILTWHDWTRPVGKCAPVAELAPGDSRLPATTPDGAPWPRDGGGLVARVVFNLDTQRGAEAYADAKFYGPDGEWSIGYNVPAGEAKTVKGIRHIRTVDLYEGSMVLWGAAPLARTLAVDPAVDDLDDPYQPA